MMNLNDILASAHGGEAIQTLAKQFKISTDQAEAAVNAMLPVFSMGLQQQATSADSFVNLVTLMTQNPVTEAFENPALAKSKDAVATGQQFMTQLFGGTQAASKEVQAQMAQQAAALTGLGPAVLQKMLPVIASLILSGLFKGAQNNGLGGILGQIIQGSMGQGSGQAQNPMGDLLGSILGGLLGGGGPAQKPADQMSQGIDILKGMFETGQQVQQQQMSGMENIFDQIMKAQKR